MLMLAAFTIYDALMKKIIPPGKGLLKIVIKEKLFE